MALTDILKDIANAIRAKNGEETQYKPSEMAAAIGAISGGGGGVDYSALESVLSDGYTNYKDYLRNRVEMTEAPAEILQHTETGKTFSYMFYNCKGLTYLLPLKTSNGEIFDSMFYGCEKLHTIAGIDFSSATSANNMFARCKALKNITINGVIKITGVEFLSSNDLTHDSIMSFINALYDHKAAGSTGTYTLTLGSTNLAKLTDAEKAIATEKGWTLA